MMNWLGSTTNEVTRGFSCYLRVLTEFYLVPSEVAEFFNFFLSLFSFGFDNSLTEAHRGTTPADRVGGNYFLTHTVSP
jgi:hypothetical protein